jgi:hypothetical protein
MVGISVVAGVSEPLRAYNWEVDLPAEFGNVDKLKYQIQSVKLPPWVDIDTESVRWNNMGALNLPAGFNTKLDVSISFWEDEALSIHKYFEAWRKKVVKSEDYNSGEYREVGLPSTYVRTVKVYYTNLKGNRIGGYTLIGSYPIGISDIDLSYSESKVVEVSVNFACSNIIRV